MKQTTDELLKTLKEATTIDEYVEQNYEEINNLTFVEYLTKCMEQCSMTRAQIIDGSNIQKNYGYQIFDGTKKPSRNKVLALCFSMALSVDDANRLLKLSDHSILYPRIKRDSIIIFALEKKQNLINTNILLYEMKEDIIE